MVGQQISIKKSLGEKNYWGRKGFVFVLFFFFFPDFCDTNTWHVKHRSKFGGCVSHTFVINGSHIAFIARYLVMGILFKYLASLES